MMNARVMGKPGKRSVDDAARLLKRFYLVEREVMRTLGGYLVSASNWDLKKTLPRHIWEDSLRANRLRERILELRYPRRDVDQGHDQVLTAFLSALIKAKNDKEWIAGVYFVTKKALLAAYENYLSDLDPLDDSPTEFFLSGFPAQLKKQLAAMEDIHRQLDSNDRGQSDWSSVLLSYLNSIGGICGLSQEEEGSGSDDAVLPFAAERPEYVSPAEPVRDPRFAKAYYHMPQREPKKFIEQQVWLGINHLNEIWAAEAPGTLMWKWNDLPWEHYLNLARWCYDESRHCLMGERRLKAWGFEIGVDVPIYGDHYISAVQHGELALLAMIHYLESDSPEWKSGLKKQFEAEGDTASSQDFDYDWADEAIHLQYGYKLLMYKLGGDDEALENLMEESRIRWDEWINQAAKTWDYEPFMSRIDSKIAALEATGERV